MMFVRAEIDAGLIRVSCVTWVVVILSFIFGCAPGAETLRFLRVSRTSLECLNCVDGAEKQMVAEMLAKRPDENIDSWFQKHFRVPNEELNRLLENTPLDRRREEFASFVSGPWGFEFKWGDGVLRYSERSRKFFDGYLAYLELEDTSGRIRWTRKVPFLDAPIHPFVADGRITYVGRETSPLHLVVVGLDLATGRLVRKVAVPYPPEISIGIAAPSGTFPYSAGEAVVLQGTSLFVEGGKAVPGARTARIPADILILPGGSD